MFPFSLPRLWRCCAVMGSQGLLQSFQDHGGSAETFDNWQVGMMKKILALLIY